MKGFVDLVKESVDFSDVKKAATSNSSQPLDLIATSVKIEITPTSPTGGGTTTSKVETTMEEKLKDQIMKGVNSVIDLKPAGDNMPTMSTVTVVKVSGVQVDMGVEGATPSPPPSFYNKMM